MSPVYEKSVTDRLITVQAVRDKGVESLTVLIGDVEIFRSFWVSVMTDECWTTSIGEVVIKAGSIVDDKLEKTPYSYKREEFCYFKLL